ncbi:hypothetical protein G0U57_015907 [Chelydra serpentina]|uniref:Uncharacterized protein n=1 Tax=Chelydra serpentina TaxID=8475 RepID=A0A8T1TIE2_CHESE|nr:hypothetical protein G0U57_015907 [Chelydra serpentina]
MLRKRLILSALLVVFLVDLIKPQEASITPVSGDPTMEPSIRPSMDSSTETTGEPSGEGSGEPSGEPSRESSVEPISESTREPTVEPTKEPSTKPTKEPCTEPPRKLILTFTHPLSSLLFPTKAPHPHIFAALVEPDVHRAFSGVRQSMLGSHCFPLSALVGFCQVLTPSTCWLRRSWIWIFLFLYYYYSCCSFCLTQ